MGFDLYQRHLEAVENQKVLTWVCGLTLTPVADHKTQDWTPVGSRSRIQILTKLINIKLFAFSGGYRKNVTDWLV